VAEAGKVTCQARLFPVRSPDRDPACCFRAAYAGAVTDIDETAEQPDLLSTHYLTSIEDVTEHLRAASRLGLGVRVRSYLEADDEEEALAEHWEVELFTSSPVHEGEAAEPIS
jgi:hypothetical protein